jgi:putative protein-disulfide isomerase
MALPKLVYGFDPLCGWCYVFGQSIDALRVAFRGRLELELVCGGLIMGDNVRPLREMRGFLEKAIPRAEAKSGVQFGKAFTERLLVEGEAVLDSEPLCRAIFAARDLAFHEDGAYQFGKALGEAFYRDGQRLDDEGALFRIATACGFDGELLLKKFRSPHGLGETAKGFAYARALGIDRYPTVLVRRGSRTRPAINGFMAPDDAVKAVEKALLSL